MVQAKRSGGLRVSQPGDALEIEADRVADAVMRMAAPTGCPACEGAAAPCSECQGRAVQRSAAPLVQRDYVERPEVTLTAETAEEDEQMIQRSADGELHTSVDIAQRLNHSKGGGAPLPDGIKLDLEGKMGAEFGDVRIHTDAPAVQLSRDLEAHAFTHGSDIYFNAGKYAPDSVEGKHLLVHELAHTLQQRQGVVQRLTISNQRPLAAGTCGQRNVRWIFTLDNPAPADGYIVQQVDLFTEIKDCPAMGRCLARPTSTFWEAWFTTAGSVNEHLHASFGYTDESNKPSRPGKVGYDVALGEVRFYPLSVTGDLGRDSVAPATPNGGWGPGAAPQSQSLPSTFTRPGWWGTTPTEGPANRRAYSAWRCCNNASDFNVVRASP